VKTVTSIFSGLLLITAFVLFSPRLINAQTNIGLNPPADPQPVGGAVLSYHRQLSVPRLTIPGQFVVTDTVKNVGSLSATNVTIRQELPPGWTVKGQSTLSFSLGDIAAGETASRETTIIVATNSIPGRFANEATATADGLDPVQSSVPLDLTRPAVLGATALAETGQSPIALCILGLIFLTGGLVCFSRFSLGR
jgi:hypothetical protein